MASTETVPLGRLVIQQCLKATLPVKPCDVVDIKSGMIIFVCFYKNATDSCLDKVINIIFSVKLCENDEGKLVTICEKQGDILIVPQASLGGRIKGKSFQYHNNIAKDLGLQLYQSFVQKCLDFAQKSEKEITVQSGTYGERQVLTVETNGPNTHIIDF